MSEWFRKIIDKKSPVDDKLAQILEFIQNMMQIIIKIPEIVDGNLDKIHEREFQKTAQLRKKLWHGSDEPLEIGQIIQFSGPNRFSQTTTNIAFVEEKLEEIRKKVNPNAPSRFNCIFLTNDEEVLEDMGFEYVYEVKILPGSNVFYADYIILNDIWSKPLHDEELEQLIEKYWQGGDGSEILIEGGIKIVDADSENPDQYGGY